MRALDETPIDPEILAALEAIDATLAGEAVDPRHADLAELALLLAGERPEPSGSFAHSLDERVARRFAALRLASAVAPRSGRRWWLAPAGGLLSAALAAAIVVVVLAGGLGAGSAGSRAGSGAHAVAVSAGAVAQPRSAAAPSGSVSQSSATSAAGAPAPALAAPTLQPPANGRKIIQGAQLALTTAPSRVEQVAQEVFDVVGQQNGIVESSSVTGGSTNGYAQFELSLPSGSLPQAMAALSTLPYARVQSRTDTTQDVNDQYQGDVDALADARALRTSLLKQLAGATTQAQIDSLTAQIHDAEASISSDEATLRRLNQQINFSQVTVTINTPLLVPVPVQAGGSSSGFTLGKAAHDAGRVLTVAAGVALIGIAALVPIALLAALVWWGYTAFRRRRREHALDLV